MSKKLRAINLKINQSGLPGLNICQKVGETIIGFRFLPEYWGKGIATEISTQILKYGFEELGLKKIIGFAMRENIASNKAQKSRDSHPPKKKEGYSMVKVSR